MKIYGYFRSSAAYRVRIALNLKGLAAEQHSVHLRKNEQRDEGFLQVNPHGLVPALVADDGSVLTQSLAITEYLDEIHPQPPFLPRTPPERARVRALALAVACDIHPLNNLRVLRYLMRPLGHDEATVEAWYNHWIRLGFEGLERMLADDPLTGTFCHGETPGLADICLVPQVFNAQRYKLDMSPYPTIRRVAEACNGLDAFARAHPMKQEDAEA